jgi:hypothetical protein
LFSNIYNCQKMTLVLLLPRNPSRCSGTSYDLIISFLTPEHEDLKFKNYEQTWNLAHPRWLSGSIMAGCATVIISDNLSDKWRIAWPELSEVCFIIVPSLILNPVYEVFS